MQDFFTVGITLPEERIYPEEEAEEISAFLNSNALDLFHIRKPEASEDYFLSLIEAIPSVYHKQLVIHSHFNLHSLFEFGGYHLKQGFSWPENKGFLTRSCHSIEGCKSKYESYRYSFLSPVFDSISKSGYKSRFKLNDESLRKVIEDIPVVALGGVTPDNFLDLFVAKFAGAALLGYLWSPKTSIDEKISSLLSAKRNLK